MEDPGTAASTRRVRTTGVLLVALALLFNPWVLGRHAIDAAVPDLKARLVVLGADAMLLVVGLWLLRRRPTRLAGPARFANPVLGVGVLIGVVLSFQGLAPLTAAERELVAVRRSEELLLGLGPELRELDGGVADLTLPGERGRSLFAPSVLANDLAPAPRAARPLVAGTRVAEWPTTEPVERPRDGWSGWVPFLERVAWFEHASFKLVSGTFLDQTETVWEADVAFEALAVGHDDGRHQARASLRVRWHAEHPDAPADAWRIERFVTRRFSVATVPAPFFREVLDLVLPDAEDRRGARRSLHEAWVADVLLKRSTEPLPPGFTLQSNREHPGLAVADVNADGWDDLYVLTRWGPNQLYVNQGDGTFAERAEGFGLALGDHCTSAVFADFDNDGDADVFVGRTQQRSIYLAQEDGRFVDRSAELPAGALPAMVTSVSAADADGDGLLDVYFSTYLGGLGLAWVPRPGTERLAAWLDVSADRLRDLSREHYAALMERLAEEPDPWVDRPGAPNVLLANRGAGRFEPRPGVLEAWRDTFQATWCDYDLDGDADVYLANDFAPNGLYRNDGGLRFTEVTDETGTADVGFGMGVSWGDYDLDGRQDLYVTNMFSKAGRRITAEAAAFGGRYEVAARGNSLLRQADDRFRRVSGTEPPALLVEKAGWGWGSLFVDVDNDGWLDIHALSGNYTAPPEVASLVDT